MAEKKEKSKSDIEWEKRTLCSDPACIGVIGPDGHCKECGKPYGGEPFEDNLFEESTPEPEGIETESAEPQAETDAVEISEEIGDTDSEEDIDWANRTLCSDPACIGVIGPDGRCKECGRPYRGG